MPHIKNALIRYRIIDKCIRNKYIPFPSKRDLREACEESLFGSIDGKHICDSTIEKDMFAMKMEHDAPIKYSKRERGYYYINPDFSINDIPLTDDDLGALSFAAKTLMQFKDVAMFKQFGSAIDKIADRIELSKEDDDDKFIQFETSASEGGSEFLSPLLEAIKRKLWVNFDYASFVSGELKPRKVIPLLLKQYRNRWYLISFDADKNDYITYALDRMEEMNVSKEEALLPLDFSSDNYFKHAIGITSGNIEPEEVILKAGIVSAKYLDSLPFHDSQKVVKMEDNGFTFSLTVNISEELIREIMSYGGEVKVIQPVSLLEEVQKRANRILE
ncbi:MAG: WYL domain-containing protein [Crocinitomicaceae bacterium]|nr:WYL domain-containing protein [Crocinitomicaceae bacterium]